MTNPRRAALLILPAALCACTSQVLTFEPACIAYEGDRVTLRGNQFEWSKFSDQVPMGVAGARANPFPGYPMSGTYRRDHERVEFTPEDGAPLEDYFLIEHRGARYLLTTEAKQRFTANSQLPTCALKLVTVE